MLIAVVLLALQGPDDGPYDLVLRGRVFTADLDHPRAEAVAIRGERIVRTGRWEDLRGGIGEGTQVVDAGDGTVAPGFNDAHAHFTAAYGLRHDVDLGGAADLDEILARVEAHAARHPEAPGFVGGMWDLADFEGDRFPTAADLDRAVDDRPVLLWSEGPHGLWVNTIALERGGWYERTGPDPPGTIVLRDPETEEPTGVFLGRGLLFLFQLLPPPDLGRLTAGIEEGFREAARLGVTSVHESVSAFLLPWLAGRVDAGEPTLRFHVWGVLDFGPEAYASQAAEFARGDWITFGTLKGGLDGMPGLRTAHLLEPYADDPATSGLSTMTSEAVRRAVREANEAGFAVALHAAGDGAVEKALDAFEAGTLRNRVEHAFLVSPDDWPRFAELDAVASVQPGFLAIELEKDRYYERRFGDRAESVMPLAGLLRAGATLALGTDADLTPLDPRVGLYAAVTRRPRDGTPAEAWVPEERLSLEEALRAYTYGSAVAERADQSKGRLLPGMLADVVVFREDLFELEPEALLDAEVILTVVGGRVVFDGR